jgi:hypothetical protein
MSHFRATRISRDTSLHIVPVFRPLVETYENISTRYRNYHHITVSYPARSCEYWDDA